MSRKVSKLNAVTVKRLLGLPSELLSPKYVCHRCFNAIQPNGFLLPMTVTVKIVAICFIWPFFGKSKVVTKH